MYTANISIWIHLVTPRMACTSDTSMSSRDVVSSISSGCGCDAHDHHETKVIGRH